MADCERLKGCPFFKNLTHLPRTAYQLVTTYCQGDSSGCARLWVISNGVRPPDDLFPNERDRALVILSNAGKSPAAVVNGVAAKKAANKG